MCICAPEETESEQATEGHHRDNPQGVGSREVKKPRRDSAGPNPEYRALERSLTIRQGCSSAGGRCADARDDCGVRGQAWGLAGEVTRALTASGVVLRISLKGFPAVMAQLAERELAKVEAVGSNPTIRSNRRAPFDPGLVLRESDAHGTRSGYRVPPPIRQFGLPEASVRGAGG